MNALLLLLLLFGVPDSSLAGLGGTLKQHQLAADIATVYELDSLLIFAIVQVESGWQSTARSSEGCIGLMQIYPKYHGGWEDSAYYNDALNIKLGCVYLVELRKQFGKNMEQMVTAYNYGQYHPVTLNNKTSGYARKVLELYYRWDAVRFSFTGKSVIIK